MTALTKTDLELARLLDDYARRMIPYPGNNKIAERLRIDPHSVMQSMQALEIANIISLSKTGRKICAIEIVATGMRLMAAKDRDNSELRAKRISEIITNNKKVSRETTGKKAGRKGGMNV